MSADVIGLVPAAGRGSRLQPLPCSKELLPVGSWVPPGANGPRPTVASHYLLDAMRRGGAERALIILRRGKWDVLDYWGDGSLASLPLAYLIARLPFGIPYTLDQAYPFVRDALVLVGMPDHRIRPVDAFVRLRRRQRRTGSDVVLGVFRARKPYTMDMVDLDGSGRLRTVAVKPATTTLEMAWLLAVWTPAFTEYLHAFCEREEPRRVAEATRGEEPREVYVGHVLEAALADGLSIEGVQFPDGSYVDLGDAEQLMGTERPWREPWSTPLDVRTRSG